MIFQTDYNSRFLFLQGLQLFISISYLVIAYSVLRRQRNRLTFTLSGFYIMTASGFIVNALRLSFQSNPEVYIIYSIGLFLIMYGQIFLVLYNVELEYLDTKLPIKRLFIILIGYGIIVLTILVFSQGFAIGKETEWFPVYNWRFLLILYINTTVLILLPFYYFNIKLYRSFESNILKKKLRLYLIGFSAAMVGWYGGTLYLTWNNVLYRASWGLISLILAIFSGACIYFAFGRGIK